MSSIAPHPRPPPSPRAPGVAAPRRSPRPASWRQRPTGRGAALRPPGGACGPLRSAGPCASSGARVPAVAEMMPARRTLAAGSFAVRASLLCRQRLRPVLRRRPRPEAPCGLAGSEPGKRVPGGRRRGDETAESASEHRASRRCAPVPGEKRGGRRVPGEVAAEGSPASSTGDRAAQELRQQLTRKQWRNRQKNKRRQNNKFKASDRRLLASSVTDSPQDDQGGLTLDTEVPGRQALSLRQRLESRLDAARFRYINQLLYTRSSREAAQLFQEDPEALAVYHRGFALQAARWPERPTSLPSCGRLWLRGLHPGSQLAQPGTLLRPGGPGPAGDRLRHGTGAAGGRLRGRGRLLPGADGHQPARDPARGLPRPATRGDPAGGRGGEPLRGPTDLPGGAGPAGLPADLQGRFEQLFLHLRAAQELPGGSDESGRGAARPGAAAVPIQAPVTLRLSRPNKGPSCWRVAAPV
ncbi:ribosomal RNA-processing protein 8 isoform X3 [Ahaetulla prasina]|uniref:ribosomal RNA-processing protein 8 isoform X3 n=1 Tax=Ahaetulla prasina TaxID=499056 RepID=UPI0026476A0D|nr:ribosomal RNA-processing protein 8 isoform X3 [Ahaetulla prasina]